MVTSQADVAVQKVRIGSQSLEGDLRLPEQATGLVIFAHGSGSSRLSPRNTHVASLLNEHELATLLFDLLTEDEAADRTNVFNISLLADRLAEAIEWAGGQEKLRKLPIGLFGASTGAGAALVAAARMPSRVAAVVSRGGRPDLAGDALGRVRAPTLLIVGGEDVQVIGLNELAQLRLRCPNMLEVVPGATHLFEEPGTLDQAASMAAGWFMSHLGERRCD